MTLSSARACAPAVHLELPGLPAKSGSAAAGVAAAEWAALAHVVAGGGLVAGRVRVSRDGGRSYPQSRERPLTTTVPADQPAAVRLYDSRGDARCLAADFDIARGGQGQVDRDVARLLELVERCGGRAFTDRSPSGGRHVYLPLAQLVPYEQMRPLMYALAALLPSLDIAPAVNLLAGCLRPPGARHKTGGWQRLDGPLSAAEAVARTPNPPAVWAALSEALRPQLAAQQPIRTDPSLVMAPEAAGAAGPKERRACQALAARPGGPRRLRPAVLDTARTGAYDTARYTSPSQARQSVLAAAAASGWAFTDVTEQLHAGQWPGLWAFYARYPDRYRREALAGDWLVALTYAAQAIDEPSDTSQDSHVHNPDTREPATHRGGALPSSTAIAAGESSGSPAADSLNGHQYVRAWWTAVRHAERDRYTGKAGQSRRLVLRAIGAAGQKTGRRHIRFGCRSLAIATGLSKSTVATELQALSSEPDPLLTHLVAGRGLVADLYELRIPDAYAERARTDPWRPGRIEALLPVFRVLGVCASFVYEVLDGQPQSSWDLAHTSLISTRSAQHALAELASHGLATRDRDGWRRGDAAPTDVAHTVGADQLVEQQIQRYRADRRAWQIRLGAYPGPSIPDLLRTPPGPAEPVPPAPERWLPALAQPPPAELEEAALQVVQAILGGVVLSAG